MLPSVRLPRPSRKTPLAWIVAEPTTTFCWAVLVLSANWMRFAVVPMGPVVSSVTVAPVVLISADVLFAAVAVMPAVPAVRLMVPPLPFRAVPVFVPSSRMIPPAPLVDCTTTVAAPALVAGVAVVKVMLPVWLLSPKVTVPLASVVIRVNSVSVRLTPTTALLAPPILMGRVLWEVRTTTPPPAPVALTFVPEAAVRSMSARAA